jgi:hypothetical protein
LATRVYKYGIQAPLQNADLVRDQIFRAHKYYNTVLASARAERDGFRALDEASDVLGPLKEAQDAAQEALEQARKDLAKIRQKTRSRGETKAQRDHVKEMREQAKQAKQAFQAKRKELKEQHRPLRETIHEEFLAARRAARKESGLYWGTYICVEAALGQACGSTPLYDKDGKAKDPKWRQWRHEGTIAVQLQKGMTTEQLFSCTDTRARLEVIPDRNPNRKRKVIWGRLWLRIGSEGASPVWAIFPVKLHRDLPADASIRWIKVHLKKVGPRDVWTVDFTLRTEPAVTCGNGAVAIDLGWRKMGDEIRVAAWVDNDGERGELRLDAHTLAGLQKHNELRSVRDQNRNEMLAKLMPLLQTQALPEWFRNRTVRKGAGLPSQKQALAYLAQWQSFARLASLARFWAENRWEGDEESFLTLEAWRYQDFHLWQWEANQRRGSLNHRRDIYRNVAARLADRYSVIVVEDFDISKIAEKNAPEDDARQETGSTRQLVAPHTFITAIKSAASARGAAVVEVDCRNSTRECPQCGFTEAWDAAASVQRVPPCPKCGSKHDQDYGAAEVLLGRYKTLEKDAPAKSVEKTESKWERVRRQRAEKLARNKALSAA